MSAETDAEGSPVRVLTSPPKNETTLLMPMSAVLSLLVTVTEAEVPVPLLMTASAVTV